MNSISNISYEKLGAGLLSIGRSLRRLSGATRSASNLSRLHGNPSQYAKNLARKAERELINLNDDLVNKDISRFNIPGRFLKRKYLKDTNKYLSEAQSAIGNARSAGEDVIADAITKKPKKKVLTKRNLVIGGGLLGAAAFGDKLLNNESKDTENNYNAYY